MEFCQSTGFRHFVCDTIAILGLMAFFIIAFLIIYKFILIGIWGCLRNTFKSIKAICWPGTKAPRRWMYLDYHVELSSPTTISQFVMTPSDYDPPPEYPYFEVDTSPPAYQTLRFDYPSV